MVKSSSLLLVVVVVIGQWRWCQSIRERRSDKHFVECDEEKRIKMQFDFSECINEFTRKHHDNTGKATKREEFQMYTCQMLSETVGCGDLWFRCHTPDEVRSMKDNHVAARINQFVNNREGVDVHKCGVVEEYVESGRGGRVDQATEGSSCSMTEIHAVQAEFQDCSHNLTSDVWDEIKELEDKELVGKDVEPKEKNDVLEDEIDREWTTAEIRPRLCGALLDIGRKCAVGITKCFSREDMELMRNQHVHSMAAYYSNLYRGVDLSDCPALNEFSDVVPEYDAAEEMYDDENYYDYEGFSDVDKDVTTTVETENRPGPEHQRLTPALPTTLEKSESNAASINEAGNLVAGAIVCFLLKRTVESGRK